MAVILGNLSWGRPFGERESQAISLKRGPCFSLPILLASTHRCLVP